ncbi:MAG: hypothetical protein ACREYC_24565 [Gammaproteobacteria bacterium]
MSVDAPEEQRGSPHHRGRAVFRAVRTPTAEQLQALLVGAVKRRMMFLHVKHA